MVHCLALLLRIREVTAVLSFYGLSVRITVIQAVI